MTAGLKGIFVGLAVIVTLMLGLVWGLYAHGASALPRRLVPTDHSYPVELRQLYWRTLGGTGDIHLRRLNPLKVAWRVFRHSPDAETAADLQALRNTARIRGYSQARDLRGLRRNLAETAYEIRISREWTPEQIVDTTLAEAGLGRNAQGMDAAATAYFGVPLLQLTPGEQLALLAMAKAPSFHDPSCRRARFIGRYRFVAAKAGMDASPAAIDTALKRLLPIPCT